MALNAPFIMKLSFYSPSKDSQSKNVAHIDYITREDAVDYGALEPENRESVEEAREEIERGELIHLQYMHERPRSSGLFGENGDLDINDTKCILGDHEGIVWRCIVSLREDDAIRLERIERSKWEDSLKASFTEIQDKLGIPASNFRWAAAYHPEQGHPHCHLLFWEEKPVRSRGKLSQGELTDIRKVFVKNICTRNRDQLLMEKEYYRNAMRNGVRDLLLLKKNLQQDSANLQARLGGRPGIAPKLYPEQEQYLNSRLEYLSGIMPGHGRVAFNYMPEEVKAEVNDIADWIMKQPGFAEGKEQYMQANLDIVNMYMRDQQEEIKQAMDRAYNDLRKRIAQDVLKGAVNLQRHKREVQNIDFTLEPKFPDTDHQGQENANGPSKEEKETEAWYRSTFRLVERERAAVITGERLKLPEFTNYQEGLNKLTELASQIPDDFQGQPVIAFLPDELKEQVREAADWLLANPEIQCSLRDYLETIQGDPDAVYNQIRDRVAENALFHALRLLNREMPNIQMVLHEQRAWMAKDQLSRATADVVLNDTKEAKWTLFKMHEALTKMGAPGEEIQETITRWARDAGIESSVERVLQRTYDGKNDIDFMGKANWNRMCDNLGYHEHELLNPWMGQIMPPEEQEQETEPTQQQPATPITPPDFLPEHVPAILETYNSVIANPELAIDKDELQWTIWTSSWVLKELGVDTQIRLQILNGWVQRSGIEMSQARVADTIHRSNLVHEEDAAPRWLGCDNWERLMRNIGAETPPDRPWEYPAQGFNLAGAIWKGLWQSVQRERTKSEYQAKRLQNEYEREEKAKRREGRER